MWCAVCSSEAWTGLSCPGPFLPQLFYFSSHWLCTQGEQGETCRSCISVSGSLLLSLSGYLQCKTNCIKCSSSLFLRAVIMHSQTTNMGVECDGVNICCYYANYAFCVDLLIIVTNKTHLCCVNSRVWVTPFFKLLLYTYICTDLGHTTNEKPAQLNFKYFWKKIF